MGVNKVILLGHLGQDPEIKYTASQMAVGKFSIATKERKKDSESGQWTDHTEWHRIVVFGKQAEFCGNFLSKGRQVYVEGRLRTNKWQDKDGNNRYTTEVIASVIEFADSKGGGGQSQGQKVAVGQDFGLQSADDIASDSSGGGDVPFDDDDIPF